MELKFLFLFLLCCPLQGYGWRCGNETLEKDKVCDCSGKNITQDESLGKKKGCCPIPGRGHENQECEKTPEGDVRCSKSRVCYGDFKCGKNLTLTQDQTCFCSEEEISAGDYWEHKKRCCTLPGSGHCKNTTEGDVRCRNSRVCQGPTYKCGNTTLGSDKTCYCSQYKLSSHDYEELDLRCCPPGNCSVTNDGNVECHNSTVYNKKTQPCNGKCHSSRNLCPVEKEEGAGHQVCYDSSSNKNDRTYHCVNRADEKGKQENEEEKQEEFKSIVACEEVTGPGLMCGDECVSTNDWCSNDENRSRSCGSFTTRDSILCQNFTFWNNKDCTKTGTPVTYGKRCTGSLMSCHYPAYMSSNYENNEACSDKSDQIHKPGPCKINQHLDIYKDHFCNDKKGKSEKGKYCDEIRNDPAGWISRLREELKNKSTSDRRRKTIEDILNPHNCQASCLTPGYGCEACTNSSYIRCPVNGTESCLHPDLECDGHPQCDNAEDEDFWKCRTKLIKLKRVKKIATLYCISKMYPDKNHWTAAVACDGNSECHEDQDEGPICQKINLFTWIGVPTTFLILVCIMALVSLYKWYSDNAEEKENEIHYEEKISDEAITLFHETKTEINLNVTLLRNDLLNDKETRIKGSRTFFRSELERNGRNLAKTVCSIKNYLYASVYSVVHEDYFPGIFRKYFSPLEDFLKKIRKIKIFDWLLRYVKQIAVIYIDNLKDRMLVVSIVSVVGLTSLFYFPIEMSSVIVFCLLFSTICPMLLSSLILAIETIEDQENLTCLDKTKIVAKNLSLCFFNPLILINRLETIRDALRESALKHKNEEVLAKLEDEQKMRKKLTDHVRMELQLETINQTSLQSGLLLLSKTATPTTGGLETFFDNTSEAWLIISILWGIKTSFSEHLKHVSLAKPHLKIASKALVYIMAALAASKRILVMVMFFVPALGLFSILHHWQAEQIPFYVSKSAEEWGKYPGMLNKTTDGELVYLGKSGRAVAWSLIDRYSYSAEGEPLQPPHYAVYTGFRLRHYFFLFVLLYVLQTLAIFITKYIVVTDFRKANIIKQFAHSLENCGIVIPFKDWDVDHGSVEEHRKRFIKVNREVIVTMIVNFFFNFIMLVPLMYTANKILERHDLLGETIGQRPEEIDSYENVLRLLILVLPYFLITSILEPVVFLVYQHKFHPWKDIITDN